MSDPTPDALRDLDWAVRQLMEGRRNHPNLDPEWLAVKAIHLDELRRAFTGARAALGATRLGEGSRVGTESVTGGLGSQASAAQDEAVREQDLSPPAVGLALHDLERAANELDRPQTDWRWDELRLVRTSFNTLRAALGAQPEQATSVGAAARTRPDGTAHAPVTPRYWEADYWKAERQLVKAIRWAERRFGYENNAAIRPGEDWADVIIRMAGASPLPLREPSPQPCTDVHRVVNGVCENCGMRFPSERALEAAMGVFRANPAVWVNRDDDWLEQALVAAYKVDGLRAPAPSGVPRETLQAIVDRWRDSASDEHPLEGAALWIVEEIEAILRAYLGAAPPREPEGDNIQPYDLDVQIAEMYALRDRSQPGSFAAALYAETGNNLLRLKKHYDDDTAAPPREATPEGPWTCWPINENGAWWLVGSDNPRRNPLRLATEAEAIAVRDALNRLPSVGP